MILYYIFSGLFIKYSAQKDNIIHYKKMYYLNQCKKISIKKNNSWILIIILSSEIIYIKIEILKIVNTELWTFQ